MAPQVLESFLVKLGFSVDLAEQQKFIGNVEGTAKRVETAFLNAGNSIGKMFTATGAMNTSITNLKVLQNTFKDLGYSEQQAAVGLQTLYNKIKAFPTPKDYSGFLKAQLGVSALDANGNLKDSAALLGDIVKSEKFKALKTAPSGYRDAILQSLGLEGFGPAIFEDDFVARNLRNQKNVQSVTSAEGKAARDTGVELGKSLKILSEALDKFVGKVCETYKLPEKLGKFNDELAGLMQTVLDFLGYRLKSFQQLWEDVGHNPLKFAAKMDKLGAYDARQKYLDKGWNALTTEEQKALVDQFGKASNASAEGKNLKPLQDELAHVQSQLLEQFDSSGGETFKDYLKRMADLRDREKELQKQIEEMGKAVAAQTLVESNLTDELRAEREKRKAEKPAAGSAPSATGEGANPLNNPFNVRPAGKSGFKHFGTTEDGVLAGVRQIKGYANSGLNRLDEMLDLYAPASDKNDPRGYAKSVSDMMTKRLGRRVGVSDRLDLSDPQVLGALSEAMMNVESRGFGTKYYEGNRSAFDQIMAQGAQSSWKSEVAAKRRRDIDSGAYKVGGNTTVNATFNVQGDMTPKTAEQSIEMLKQMELARAASEGLGRHRGF